MGAGRPSSGSCGLFLPLRSCAGVQGRATDHGRLAVVTDGLARIDNHRNGHGNLREAMPRAHLGQPGYLGSLTTDVVTGIVKKIFSFPRSTANGRLLINEVNGRTGRKNAS